MRKCESCGQEVTKYSLTHHGDGTFTACEGCTVAEALKHRKCCICKNYPNEGVEAMSLVKKKKAGPIKINTVSTTSKIINDNLHIWIECIFCKGSTERWLIHIKCNECGKSPKSMIESQGIYYCNKECFKIHLNKLKSDKK